MNHNQQRRRVIGPPQRKPNKPAQPPPRHNQLKILSWNIKNFMAKGRKENLQQYVEQNKVDIILLQETATKRIPKLSGYKVYDLSMREAGRGLTTFVRRSILSTRYDPPELLSETQTVAVTLTLKEKKIDIQF